MHRVSLIKTEQREPLEGGQGQMDAGRAGRTGRDEVVRDETGQSAMCAMCALPSPCPDLTSSYNPGGAGSCTRQHG